MSELEALQRARGEAKRKLIAQAIVIAKEAEVSGSRIRSYISQMKNGDLEEYRMVEEVVNEVHRCAGESPLTQLIMKYEMFLIHDMELRRSINSSANRLGVL